MKCLLGLVIASGSFHLQAIITVTFEVPGDIREENLNLFIQVSNMLLSSKKIIVAFYRKALHAILLMKHFSFS